MAILEITASDLKVGDKVYDTNPTDEEATCFIVLEISERYDIMKLQYVSGPEKGYYGNDGVYGFGLYGTWYKVVEVLKPENYALWIKLRAEVIKHFHDTYNRNKFTGEGYNMLYAIKIAESELKNSIIDQEFIISLDEMLLNSLDECVTMVIERQNKYIQRLISRY